MVRHARTAADERISLPPEAISSNRMAPDDSSNSAPALTPTSMQHTVFEWALSEMVDPESTFHSLIEPSSLPETRNSQSEEKKRHEISDCRSVSTCHVRRSP